MVGRVEKKENDWHVLTNFFPKEEKFFIENKILLHPEQCKFIEKKSYKLELNETVEFEIIKFCMKHQKEFDTKICDSNCLFHVENVAKLNLNII